MGRQAVPTRGVQATSGGTGRSDSVAHTKKQVSNLVALMVTGASLFRDGKFPFQAH